MNVLICHERFLFRFGADRVLLLLAKGLKEQGHHVALMGNRYDSEVVNSLSSRVIDCPEGASYIDLNEFTAEWLRSNWHELFAEGNRPDVVIIGGWPFFSSIPLLRDVCPHVIFIDFGVVPISGYSEDVTLTLSKLRTLRKEHLNKTSLIVGISRFIVDTQSLPDCGHAVPVKSVLLGADHMEKSLWPAAQLQTSSSHTPGLTLIRSLKLQGKKVILCLGRWEPGCYKNSQVALDVMERVAAAHSRAVLVILDQASNVQIPAHLQNNVLAIGFPDDRDLAAIMRLADVGVSTSLWEGFNLPLAEMQWFGRPSLVFNVGAHPEVVAHPWYLCTDTDEMASKTVDILSGRGPDSGATADSLERFRDYFRWERFIDDYTKILDQLTGHARPGDIRPQRVLFVDVTNSTRDTANSGVVRVTRRLGRELQLQNEALVFLVWDETLRRYVLPTRDEYDLLSQFNGPVLRDDVLLSSSHEQRICADDLLSEPCAQERWLLLPELMRESSFRQVRKWAREQNVRIAAIFYDAIPLLRPDLCNEEVRANHRDYMLGLAECDIAIPISHFSGNCLQKFWSECGLAPLCQIAVDVLPGEFGGSTRKTFVPNKHGAHILCVSTLEPRKNHRNLIQACLWMAERYPALEWSLTLVGNRYAGAFEIADWIREVSTKEPRIQWLGVVDDSTLNLLYEKSAFTVYASVIEGFGLPILESIWHGRPCICYNRGVMAELAEGGACLTTDVTDPVQLGEAIHALASDEELRLRLSREASARPVKTWKDYVVELQHTLDSQPRSRTSVADGFTPIHSRQEPLPDDWQRVLYPNCRRDNWQMNDSERMTLTGLLARHKPHCSIEVGTYHGGSLSLISQYSNMVFSIDIDETIPSRFKFPNVSFLTGPSNVLLPHLLRELDKANIPVDFVLVDGDHSENGVMTDIGCLLTYVPRNPMFVLLHDSFNPACRRGMLNAGWDKSPYCHWVELDFVPGRVVEHPGPSHGELWGGLAAAYFLPAIRRRELHVNRTAQEMFEALSTRAISHASS